MAKENIKDIVTKPVSVEVNPSHQPEHKALPGGQAMAGSPAGSEAKPHLVRQGSKTAGMGK